MDKRRRNITAIGLLVVVAATVFTWGFFFLLGEPVLTKGNRVFVVLENGAGLKRGDRVQLQGVTIGTVREVLLAPSRSVSVELRLTDGIKLPADTRAIVRGDVFGAHTVDLLPGAAIVKLESGDTMRGSAAAPLPQVASELSEQARAILTHTDSLLSPRTVADMRATAATLPSTALEMRGAFIELHRAAASLRKSSQDFEQARTGPALSSALGQMEQSARALTGAANSMERSLNSMASVMGKIDSGRGTLGRLVNDSTLYRDMQDAMREMKALAVDIRTNPKRYVNVKVF
jgi:phospholipid/cholesterol/gamma-HCH transport system substrate-binding protein